MSTKVDAAIDAPVAALAELPKHELEFWQRGNRLGVRVLYELNRRYPALAPWRRRRPRFAVSRPDFEHCWTESRHSSFAERPRPNSH